MQIRYNFLSLNRSWDKELKETMKELRKNLEAESENYLYTNIKQKILKVGKN